MSSELFEEWVRELDRKFGVEKRNIAMIIDNCKAHPHFENLGWVELIFLPPNTTSVTQPMDQGIICSLKVAKPPISEVHKVIEILEKFTLFSRSGEDLMSSLKVVNRVIHAEEQLSKKQSTINAYFRKEK